LKIAGTLIAEAWAKNDLQQIKDIYYKSCINQFLIGSFLFLGIWANIDNILTILGPDYLQSKWVIFFIAIGNLFDMMTGTNSIIISYSKHYRMMFTFTILLIIAVLALLYLFIPLWGITGAAIAIAATLALNNLMRYIFLYRKYQMQPFNMKFLLVAAFFTGVYFLLELIPQQQPIIDILVRGSIITVLSGLFVIVSPVSGDITLLLNKLKERLYKW
jgi:O-antigen/teichoic acid export membrane protein